MGNDKWFGREPALYISTLGALLAVLVGFGLPGLNDTLAAALVAVATAGAGVWTALHVKPVAPTVFTSLIIAGAALGVELGTNVTQQQVALITAAATTIMTLVLRAQITPAHDPLPIGGVDVVDRGSR